MGKEAEDLTRHDKWLCMMYPRLKLLSKLLDSNGVIFISIGDDEMHNLKILCDEIFGKKNFLASLIWNTEGNTDNQLEIKVNHEYILVYLKNHSNKSLTIGNIIDPNTREDSNLWQGIADNNINKNNPRNPPVTVKLPIGFPSSEKTLSYDKKAVDTRFFEVAEEKRMITDDLKSKYKIENQSGLPVKLDNMIVKNHKLTSDCRIYGGLANHSKLKKFIENKCHPIKDGDGELRFYINANAAVRYERTRPKARNILSVLRNFGTTKKQKTSLKREYGITFNYPKPIDLVKYIISIGAEPKDAIVLDSFAGSGTTAEAVMALNKTSGNRKFILIEMEDYAETATAQRVKKAAINLQTNQAFDYYDLGKPLFIGSNNEFLNEEVGLQPIRQYVWYSETRSALASSPPAKGEYSPQAREGVSEPYLLGSKNDTAYYFVYEKDSLTTLDHEMLATIKTKAEQFVIYADNCLLSKDFMEKHNIIFKKIPRDITRF
ncbi:MAG: site-specific DNA-methyltransferase [Flavobacteriales bacterium]|nr:site-specific DNA-methyltransferase [Flavobacteriales bacterium]